MYTRFRANPSVSPTAAVNARLVSGALERVRLARMAAVNRAAGGRMMYRAAMTVWRAKNIGSAAGDCSDLSRRNRRSLLDLGRFRFASFPLYGSNIYLMSPPFFCYAPNWSGTRPTAPPNAAYID